MAIINFFWKVWLRINLLTKDVDNDYTAEVSTAGNTKRNEDIAREIIKEGSEIKFDTLVNILNQSDKIERQMIQLGNSVQRGNVKLSPRITGSWIGPGAKYDPSVHKITLDAVITADMRNALAEVGADVLGVKDSGAFINLVTDTATRRADGSITPNDDILIEGDRLKIAPEDEAGLGVFFVDSTGAVIPVTRLLTQNDPKKIVARVPDLPSGQYTLRVVTRYAKSSLLNEPRTIEYGRMLTVP